MKLIQSRDNPLYKKFSKLASSARYRTECAETLLDGAHLLAAYLDAGKSPKQLVVTGAALDNPELAALLARAPGIECTLLEDRLLADSANSRRPPAFWR